MGTRLLHSRHCCMVHSPSSLSRRSSREVAHQQQRAMPSCRAVRQRHSAATRTLTSALSLQDIQSLIVQVFLSFHFLITKKNTNQAATQAAQHCRCRRETKHFS